MAMVDAKSLISDVFEHLPIAGALVTTEHRIISINRELRRCLNETSVHALSYRPLASLFHGGEEIVRAITDSQPGPIRGRLRARSGTPGLSSVLVHWSDFDLPPEPDAAALEFPQDRWRMVVMVDASKEGAALETAAQLSARLAESEKQRARLASVTAELAGGPADEPPVMIGHSAALQRVREQVSMVAQSDATVLIHGETGSGKELVARSIHAESRRRQRAFVAVNCAALPESLIESELFGHERGAFTGADRQRLGKFEVADGGTLFLDEVAELPLQAQAKLLRVLQDGSFQRVGGTETVWVDVRVVTATHRELARQVERGQFREDLFYRLNVFRIEVPPLRERREDLKDLAEYLHRRVAKRMARTPRPLSAASLRRIMAYRWPGNIRELANAVERATLVPEGEELEIQLPDSPAPEMSGRGGAAGSGGGSPRTQTRDILLDLTAEQLERLHIMHVMESCGGRVFGPKGAAAKLEVNPRTLLSRMDRYGIPRPRDLKRQ